VLIAGETIDTNLKDLATFVEVYHDPIVMAISSLPFVRDDDVEDIVQSFFVKVEENHLLERYREKCREGQLKSFRGWLFRSLRNHAADFYRRRGNLGQNELFDPLIKALDAGNDAATEDETLYALSILHLAINRVRRHWRDHAKPDIWASFEEVFVRKLFPERRPDQKDEGRDRRPITQGKDRQTLFNQATSVLRVFRRVLPEIIPAELCDLRSPDERYNEWRSILFQSQVIRELPIWLAFLEPPLPGPEAPPVKSEDLALSPNEPAKESPQLAHDCRKSKNTTRDRGAPKRAPAEPVKADEKAIQSKIEAEAERERLEIEWDELRVLLAFWMEKPFRDYIDDLGSVMPVVVASPVSLRSVLRDEPSPRLSPPELETLFIRVKGFAKQAYQLVRREDALGPGPESPRRTHTLPREVAQILYNLSVALALTRCGKRIDTLPPRSIKLNFLWARDLPWLHRDLRTLFSAALERLGSQS